MAMAYFFLNIDLNQEACSYQLYPFGCSVTIIVFQQPYPPPNPDAMSAHGQHHGLLLISEEMQAKPPKSMGPSVSRKKTWVPSGWEDTKFLPHKSLNSCTHTPQSPLLQWLNFTTSQIILYRHQSNKNSRYAFGS